MSHHQNQKPAVYHITVQGQLDPVWTEWFSGMVITTAETVGGNVTTILTGSVTDQAALRGILNKLWDLNLTLVSVSRDA